MTENLPVPVDTWTPMVLAKLAREIVYEIKTVEQVLDIFKISAADFERIKQLDFYKRASEQFSIEWHGADSAEKRIRLQKQAALEDALPHLGALMTDPNVTATAKIEAAKFFSKVEETRNGMSPGEKFTININLGEDKKLVMDVTPPPIPVEGTAGEIPQERQAPRDAISLQPFDKGS